jgi:acyl-[acyl-carrier-protein]-phospholipid O-acyltransferase / long-chain-fatty-acid--[acyl-carrier-protein] ligase
VVAPFRAADARKTLFTALLDAIAKHGANKPILEDVERQPLSYGRLVIGSLVLGRALATVTVRKETVGIMLPNVAGLPMVLFGLNAYGRVSALLNFSAGSKNLQSALRTGVINTLITSRRFISTAGLDAVITALAETEISPGKPLTIIYLEDIRKTIGTPQKIAGAIKSKFARQVHARHALAPDQPAVVLFTSGTEGAPKGVVLSSTNLVANAMQIYAHADGLLSPADTVLNPLPMFHSFGLTAAGLMPLLNGMKTVLYPSPLHYKQIPALIADTKATVLFATDTFLQGYARAAGPDELKTLRYIIAGAERVKDNTRALYARHGTTILEGYGATECAPVLACSLPDSARSGSVGRMLPGIEMRLEPVDGIDTGGRLVVRGPNVMSGYLLPDTPGVLVPPTDGWHDTGDIVDVDESGLISIKGRAKRFAKIGGEMISLAAVETMVTSLWPGSNHVVISLPDPRKGEQLVLVTDKPEADRAALQGQARQEGMPELWVPKSVLIVEHIPVLASGKVDFVATHDMVRTMRPHA